MLFNFSVLCRCSCLYAEVLPIVVSAAQPGSLCALSRSSIVASTLGNIMQMSQIVKCHYREVGILSTNNFFLIVSLQSVCEIHHR